ncbi:Uncharacterized protein OBRU01_15696 [Operophtera brumata]|uniref:Uncharacterized protein n=1 Tax=Operophtera brumata TaxID=104452 RepID=A0A0L7L4L1_OPEBR|nr:Uncharacterized protein OBRU01_15696 [Operophtera brumata]
MINLNDLQCDLVNRVLDDTNMSIPPFPSQDLAKLVLGYLAEEQLMTAYDEFLQASPYLDAFQNEYDRIFMTSLKSILAEYRAVKIYVETCKPNLLRKKIFQCTNLLDIVKLLENVIGLQKRQLLLQVSHRNDNIEIQTCVDRDDIPKYPKLRVKPDDQQKVKILSDVKVTNKKKQAKNATSTPVTSTPLTSTPLMQMQTIVINGTQAYKHTPVVINQKYTKDEIMAMPTLIVVPASGPSKIPTSAHCQPIMTQNSNAAANATSTSRALGPLVIDVSPSPAVIKQSEVSSKLPDLNMPDPSEVGLVKTVDYTKNASAPKDNITFGASKTPHALPPVRKSSSTPRRTTHVRVLDFATPRRILHENINEQVTSQTSDTPVEIVLSSSPNVSFVDTTVTENTRVNSNTAVVYSNAVVQNSITCDTGTGSAKEITTSSNSNQSKKSNWDTELRALVANESSLDSMITKRKKSSKKKKTVDKSDGKMEKKSSGKNIISPKIKKAPRKRRRVIVDDDDDPLPDAATEPDVPLKPTINIISGSDRVLADLQIVQENNKDDEIIQNKSNDKEEDCVETPEGDRLSLQNVIGARLNISDLLETPYKQALYDIQMGTPRFLHDLPGDPLSDIKITNIPTPRFLDTPKPVQATPSSWSSRPTDYSSGGSYYKPDDQDYMPVPDLRCIVSSSSKESVPESSDKSVEIIKDDERKSRPQRQCAKNVSYYRFATSTNKIKEVNDNIDAASTCSDSTGSTDYKNKEPAVISPRENSNTNKSGKKKRVSTKKIKSTAIKEKTKSFLKIKPRQTPTKITSSRNKKTIKSPNKYRRIRTTSKDKNVNSATPLVVAAPTKSRRKSSTPRKLDCTKSFNAENNQKTSPETIVNTKQNAACNVPHTQDSDAEQISLRWSDDGLQEANTKELPNISSANECEDISKIKEYIQTTNSTHPSRNEGSLRADLIKRGFDVETAKIIERDLLDTPPQASDLVTNSSKPKTIEQVRTIPTKKDEPTVERAIETASSVTNDLQNDQDDTDEEVEVEFSVHECNEGSKNYFEVQHDDTKEMSQGSPLRLKDKFSMDICIDDGVTVRLRATPFRFPLDQDPIGVEEIDYSYNSKETEMAVSSIINMERLYTPLKESFKAQCFEIFDSTLTSIDTPLKANSPTTDCGMTETEIVLEEQQTEKGKGDPKKRKRSTGSDESNSDTKKTKYLLTSASIQNIDIESVLTKLHGP